MAQLYSNNSNSPIEGEGSKSALRDWARAERKKINMEEISYGLVEKLREIPEYKQAKSVMIFYPLKNEVNLLSLLKDKTKNFYLPKIDGENLLCCPFGKGDELCESCFKTKEPLTEPANIVPDIVIVPTLAVDKNKNRLGYGGGFYDRFLGANKISGKSDTQVGKIVEKEVSPFKIVCIPKELVVDTIYPEEFDIPVDLVISA